MRLASRAYVGRGVLGQPPAYARVVVIGYSPVTLRAA